MYIIKQSLVLPFGFIWFLLLFSLFSLKRAGLGKYFSLLCVLALLVLSTPYVGQRLLVALQQDPPLTSFEHPAQAIVILGGGTRGFAPEYNAPSLQAVSLERVLYGAYLFNRTSLPILVSGGDPLRTGINEADVMKKILEEQLLTPVKWTEDHSHTTYENAKMSFEILSRGHITNIYLVTHARHMSRARFAFEQAGFDVIPAPTVFANQPSLSLINFVPSVIGFNQSQNAFYEWFGQLYYRFR
ncbi:MAG: protein of unknown function DUF218 [uncultured bacterium]|nr:MAG: protein of unknown function DUF218 [uncultured bacterium]HLD45166.1 YdcF family protein [bacterium]